jgi:N-acetylglucosamine malate deacetylase 1
MKASNLDVLAIGAHPDDVELGCGGTLALLARQGRSVGILHLTRGEQGTRGTAAERIAEAERAAQALGAVELDFLDCGDGGLRTGPAEEDALIERLRRWRPELVLGPTPRDRHPDHGRSHQLVEAACFYAGLRNRAPAAGPPHRPAAAFSYMQNDLFAPSFIVDVSAAWEVKLESLRAYRSQLHGGPSPGALTFPALFSRPLPPPSPGALTSPALLSRPPAPPSPGEEGERGRDDQPMTKVASREFWQAVEGRARHFGLLIGAELGEPFWSRLPLAVKDPLAILPGGLR